MPPVIVAVIAGTSLTMALVETAVSLVGTFVIAALTQAITSKPDPSTATTPRTITVKEPLVPWKIVYGRARVGGAWVYIHTTGNPTIGQNSALMGAIVLAAHQVDGIEKIYFGDEEVKLDSTGNAIGKYRNYVHIFKHLGTPGDPADANLIRWGDGTWTSAHTLSGMAYLSIDLAYNQDLFPSMPVISAQVRGKRLLDYRDGGTRWSDNPVLCLADYLISATYGMGYVANDLDLANFNAEASHCEELVQSSPVGGGFRMPQDAFTATPSYTWKPNAITSKTLANVFLVNSDTLGFDTGDRVILTGNALPPGVTANTPYWVIRIADGLDYVYQAFNINRTPVIRLASSLANANAGVAVTITGNGSGTIWMLDDMWSLGVDNKNLQTGDLVQIYWDGTNPLPAPLVNGGSYYYIDHGKGNLYYETSHQLIGYGHGTLAATQAQAIAGQPITLTTTCLGNFVIYKQYEKRFTCNGVVDTSATPTDIIGQLLGSCGGKVVRSGQRWRIFTAVWRGYTGSLDESYLRAAIKVDTLVSRRDLFNGVRGTFISNMNYDQPSDFPPYPNPLRPDLDIFLAEDGGERIWSPDIALPFTNTGSMAQRLAKILLMQIRKQITLVFPATLKAFGVTVGEVVLVNLPRMGWASKPFEVVDWALRMDAAGGDVPIPGIDITLRETDPAVFDWSNGAETTGWWAGRTTLPYVHLVPTPVIVSVAEYLYVPSTGAGRVSGVNVAWNPVLDGFVGYYQVGYYVSPGSGVIGNENIQNAGSGTENNVQPLAAKATYCFVVRAINIFGISSPWSAAVCLAVQGITAIPPDLTNFRVEAINNQAHVTWTASPDLDVQNGGHIQLRWNGATTGAQWATSTAFILSLAGTATEATIMLKAGTYFAKAIDSAGNASTNAVSWVVPAIDKPGWQDLIVTTESPTFPGTKTSLVVSSGNLQLTTLPGASSQVDSWASVDAIADWDNEGGVVSDGEYDYSVVTDLGGKFGFRIDLDVTQTQIGLSVFGDMAPSKTYAQISVTNDPPLTGTPVWGDWQPLITGDFIGRGVRRRVMFHTDDPHSSVAVSFLRDTISMFQRMWTQQAVSLASGGTRVNYSQAFYSSPPSVGGNVFGGAIGDYVIATSRDRSGATFTIYNAAGTAKAGTADLYAFGPGSQIP